jgi:hypothetical protein
MKRQSIRLFFVAWCGCCVAFASSSVWAQDPSGPATLNAGQPPATPPRPADTQSMPAGQDPSSAPLPAGMEPLVRGPVHEGFAEMLQLTPQPTPAVPGEPPQPINESPADVRPDNPNAEWVPGYWGWDGEGKRFIWISGSWRIPPPGMRWVPGYWNATANGAQRVPGFWIAGETEQINYLPAPPPYEDEGVDPDSPPSPDVFWVPGNWAFVNAKYNWEAGYWARMVQGWMWIAAHYQWTPQGYVFVDGRWDYPINERGTLFTPIAFQNPVYQTAGFTYSPDYLVDLGLLADNLFVNPTYQDYYFGDYYGNQYQQAGIYPWYSVGTGAYLYDPIFAYQSWFDRRRNPHWRDDLRRRYDQFVRNPGARPARTWRDEQRLAQLHGSRERPYPSIVTRASQALRNNQLDRRYVRLNDLQRREALQNSDLRRKMALDRSRLEHVAPTPNPRVEGRPNSPSPQRSFRLPAARTVATRPVPEEREPVRRNPVENRGAERSSEIRPETRAEPREARPEPRQNLEERRPAPVTEQKPVPRAEPRTTMPPRRPERVVTPQRSAPPARRPAQPPPRRP